MMSHATKAKFFAVAGVALLLVAGYLWLGFDRSSFYTDHDSLQRDAQSAQLREILWSDPEQLPEAINSPLSEADPAIAADGTRLYFSRVTERGDTDLFASQRTASGWSDPEPLAINTLDNERDPSLDADGTLYFASDRPGGLGGFDIWTLPGGANEPVAMGERVNSTADDHGPTVGRVRAATTDEANEAEGPAHRRTMLAFSSDRDGGNADLYWLPLGGSKPPERLDSIASAASELSPAFSPLGDFLYFASDREAARGFDLFRARIIEGVVGTPTRLSDQINTIADELEPAVHLQGFGILFSRSDVAGGHADILRSIAREVEFAKVATSRGLLDTLLPLLLWLLLATAIALLLAALRRSITSGVWQSRVATLGLLARCVALSLAIHLLLVGLLTVLSVQAREGGADSAEGRTRVTLASTASTRGALAEQLRSTQQRETQLASADAAESFVPAPMSEPMARDQFQPDQATAATDAVNPEVASPSFTSAVAAPSEAVPSASELLDTRQPAQVSVREPTTTAPSASEPEARLAASGTSAPQPSAIQATQAVGSAGAPSRFEPAASQAAFATDRVLATKSAVQPDTSESSTAPATAPSITVAIGERPAVGLSMPSIDATQRPTTAEQPLPAGPPSSSTDVAAAPVMPSPSALLATEGLDTGTVVAGAGTAPDQVRPVAPAQATTTDGMRPQSRIAAVPVDLAASIPLEISIPGRLEAQPVIAESDLDALTQSTAVLVEPLSDLGVSPIARMQERLSPSAAAVASDAIAAVSENDRPIEPSPTPLDMPISLDILGSAMAAVPITTPTVASIDRVLTGLVLNADTRQPIASSTIRLDRFPEADLLAESSPSGTFAMAVGVIPDTVVVTAAAEGYAPQAINLTAEQVAEGAAVEFLLDPIRETILSLEPEPRVRHLGNDEFSGASNSQFQRESEGTRLTYTIELDGQQLAAIDGPAFAAMIKGIDNPNRLLVNGQLVDTFARSPRDGSFAEQLIPIPADMLVAGANTITLDAIAVRGTDIDDFEFVNARLLLAEQTDRLRLAGVVIDEVTGAVVSGAEVRLDRADAQPLRSRSGDDGRFMLRPDNLPDVAVLVATHPDYAAGIGVVSRDDVERGDRLRILLRRTTPFIVALEPDPQVRHLGNDRFSGPANSQFQREAEGIDIAYDFDLPRSLTESSPSRVELRLLVKGKQNPAPVLVNGQRIGQVGLSPQDGSYAEQVIEIPVQQLNAGSNTLEIRSARRRGNIDDFEFVNPRIIFVPSPRKIF